MRQLTETQIQLHLENNGTVCPFCFSPDITGDSIEIESGIATQTVDCSECHEQWEDVYTLTNVH